MEQKIQDALLTNNIFQLLQSQFSQPVCAVVFSRVLSKMGAHLEMSLVLFKWNIDIRVVSRVYYKSQNGQA